MAYLTLQDVLDDLGSYAGKGVQGGQVAAVRAAAQAALREMPTHHDWAYYLTRARVVTSGPQKAGTVAVTTGGLATLTGATWPSWATTGRLWVNGADYQIASVASSTVAQLAAPYPLTAYPAGTTYLLALDLYPLPADFAQAEQVSVADGGSRLGYRQIGGITRSSLSFGRPGDFGVEAMPGQPGRLALRVWPAPDIQYPVELVYRRRPAPAVLEAVPLTVKVADSGLTATGDQPVFTARHLGTVLRLGGDAKTLPTGPGGTAPAADERLVAVVTSPTVVAWGGPVPVPPSKVRATLSDLVDIEPGAMETAFFHIARRQLRHALRIKTIGNETGEEQRALAAARDADSRYGGPRSAGGEGGLSLSRRIALAPYRNE